MRISRKYDSGTTPFNLHKQACLEAHRLNPVPRFEAPVQRPLRAKHRGGTSARGSGHLTNPKQAQASAKKRKMTSSRRRAFLANPGLHIARHRAMMPGTLEWRERQSQEAADRAESAWRADAARRTDQDRRRLQQPGPRR